MVLGLFASLLGFSGYRDGVIAFCGICLLYLGLAHRGPHSLFSFSLLLMFQGSYVARGMVDLPTWDRGPSLVKADLLAGHPDRVLVAFILGGMFHVGFYHHLRSVMKNHPSAVANSLVVDNHIAAEVALCRLFLRLEYTLVFVCCFNVVGYFYLFCIVLCVTGLTLLLSLLLCG